MSFLKAPRNYSCFFFLTDFIIIFCLQRARSVTWPGLLYALELEFYEVTLSAYIAERSENEFFAGVDAAKLLPVCRRFGFVEEDIDNYEEGAYRHGFCPYDDEPARIIIFSAASVTVAEAVEFVSALRATFQQDICDGKLARAFVDGWGSWKLASLPRYENCAGYDIEGPYRFISNMPDYSYIAPSLPSYANINVGSPRYDPPRASLVLDLDETLIHTEVVPIDDADFVFTLTSSDGEGLQYMYVRKRPHAEHFLREVSKRFEVIIFTASERPYAENVLKELDPTGSLIDYLLCREDCLFIEGEFVKDLNTLGRDIRRVALVDNRPEMYCFQVDNGIPILSWFDDRQDCELLRLLPSLERLSGLPASLHGTSSSSLASTLSSDHSTKCLDVRRYIRHHWRTFEAVEKVSCGSGLLDTPFQITEASDALSSHSSSAPASPECSPPPSETSSPQSSPTASPLSLEDEEGEEDNEKDEEDLYSLAERDNYSRHPLGAVRA